MNIAILIPCYNEEKTIGKVVSDFQLAMPYASIYVYDNNSTDETADIAIKAGAIVKHEKKQGKGNVIRRMFADIQADYYILIDGDDTYDVPSAEKMLYHAIDNNLDMVTGVRKHTEDKAYRFGHVLGNKALTGLVSILFRNQLSDMLSGYRVFSKRFVKSFPVFSSGFEIETEFTVHALELNMAIDEIDTPYYERPEGSFSKLSTYKDGFRILFMIIKLIKTERPLILFLMLALLTFFITLGIDLPIFMTYFQTHKVPRIPTIILSSGFYGISIMFFVCGLIMDNIAHLKKQQKMLTYLNIR